MKIEQLREDLIKDVLTYLDEVRLPFVNKSDKYDIQNTVLQIIVDSFDEYETKTK